MKKRVLALCGAGLASSSAMSEVIYDFCHREHIDVSIDKASLLDLRGDPCCETINRYDLVVSVTKGKRKNSRRLVRVKCLCQTIRV